MIVYLPVIFILGYLSYVDIKKREVPDFWVLTLFIYSFFIHGDFAERFKIGLYVFLILFIVYIVSDKSIGGGDVKLLSVLAFLMGIRFYEFFVLMFVFMTIGFIAGVFKNKNIWFSIPLVPYIFLSFFNWFLLVKIEGYVFSFY